MGTKSISFFPLSPPPPPPRRPERPPHLNPPRNIPVPFKFMSEVKKSSKRDHKTKKDTAATTTAPASSTEPSGDAINEKTRMQVAAMKRFFDQQQVETTEWKESRQRRLAAAKTAAGDAPEQSELIMRKAYERETNLLRSRRKGPMIKSEWVPISRLGSGGFAEV